MTALKEFQRLEAAGLYTAKPGAQRRDVILALGDATLTIIDQRASDVSHWSLAALRRVNPGVHPAIFAPESDAPERIEIRDQTMIRAIETVMTAVERDRPHPGRLRARLTWLAVVAVAAAVVLWLPEAILRYTASVVPWPTRHAIGLSLMEEVTRLSGPPCGEAAGTRALSALTARVLPDEPSGEVFVVRSGVPGAAHLPGGIVLLERGVVEDHETPEVAAGYILAEAAAAQGADPLLPLLDYAGIRATLTLMTTGRLPEGALESYAEVRLADPPPPVASEVLLQRFAAAGVSSTPYAQAIDITGESTLSLIEADPLAERITGPLLSDGQWVALQGICGG